LLWNRRSRWLEYAVVLDKWDLKEGQDADKFMEQMVSDPEINKVLLIFDEAYATKANKRKGGVGTEAQIISRKVYEQQDECPASTTFPARVASPMNVTKS